MGKTILVVDDDKEINELICTSLEREEFKVISTMDGIEALSLAEIHSPDLIMLDILLPGLDGFDICSELRKSSNVPILFVSCKDEDIDKVLGFRLGGDDFIPKPFSPIELVARVKAHLRRNELSKSPEEAPDQTLTFDNLTINPATHKVFVGDMALDLSPKEFDILYHLAKNPNRVYKSDQLFSMFWDDVHIGDTHTVMVHIHNLRKKLEKTPSKPKFIQTIRGVGYKFNSNVKAKMPVGEEN